MNDTAVTYSDVPLPEDFPDESPKRSPRKATKRNEQRSGRSAFVSPICEYHPDWEFEDGSVVYADGSSIHCAKFAHLPGKGRGVIQPSPLQILRNTSSDFIKPLILLSVLGIAFFFLAHTFSGGFGGVLRPKHDVCQSASTVPASGRPAPNVSASPHPGNTDSCSSHHTSFLHAG